MSYSKVPDEAADATVDVEVGGVAPQLDDTDKIAVSLYGKDSAAGDIALNASASGNLEVDIHGSGSAISAPGGTGSDGDGARTGLTVYNRNSLYDGSASWDRERNNTEATALASAARTAQADSADITNHNAKFLQLFVNVTVDGGTAAVTPTLQVKDSISSAYHTVWTAATTIADTGTFVYSLGPGLLASVTGGQTDTENVLIPRVFRVRVTVADAESLTYSISYNLIV